MNTRREGVSMNRNKTVCFTGHRRIPKNEKNEISGDLYSAVCKLILEGYENFICGGAVGFDTLAAECVLSFKARFPEIRLILALPCRDQTMRWEDLDDLARYKRILGEADSVEYITPFYTDGCMLERNRWMVDHSAVCVDYLTSNRGGTAYTARYAAENGLRLINIATGEETEQLKFC